MRLIANIGPPPRLKAAINMPLVGISFGNPIARDYVERPAYEGDYFATPSGEAQTISTKNLRMTDDFVINPIPSNYGLITWNGSTITVS